MPIKVKWLGTRTARFDEMARFYEQVFGLEKTTDNPDLKAFHLPNGDTVEVIAEDLLSHQHFTTGPVAGFELEDVRAARAEMERVGIEFIGDVQEAGGFTWAHFRGPDGNVYELTQSSV